VFTIGRDGIVRHGTFSFRPSQNQSPWGLSLKLVDTFVVNLLSHHQPKSSSTQCPPLPSNNRGHALPLRLHSSPMRNAAQNLPHVSLPPSHYVSFDLLCPHCAVAATKVRDDVIVSLWVLTCRAGGPMAEIACCRHALASSSFCDSTLLLNFQVSLLSPPISNRSFRMGREGEWLDEMKLYIYVGATGLSWMPIFLWNSCNFFSIFI
jgi:hypothetical protein